MRGLSEYITTPPTPDDDGGNYITMEELEKIIEEIMNQPLPDPPKEGEPIVMTKHEEHAFRERGQFTREYSDGSFVYYISDERRKELIKMLGLGVVTPTTDEITRK